MHGIRNSHLIAIAPTGTISPLAGNVSSGLEPIFAGSYARKVLTKDGRPKEFMLVDYALGVWRKMIGTAAGSSAGVHHGRRDSRPCAPGDAICLAAVRRQLDLQDHQCPR